jgi:glycosyltransferase involved in cell wall biosynthesis
MASGYRVAVVAACPFPYPRGTPIRIFRIAEALAQRGCDVHVVTYHLGEMTLDAEQDLPFQIHRIPQIKTYTKTSAGPSYQKLFLNALLLHRLLQVLKAYPIDIIHAHHYEGLLVGLGARLFTRHPVIYDAHTMLEAELPFYKLGIPTFVKQIGGKLLDDFLPRHATHTITVTEDIRDQLLRHHLSPDQVSVLINGVESELFTPPAEPLPNPPEPVLVYAGGLAPFHGIECLLRALRIILDKRNDVRLRLVSTGSLAPYQSLIDTLNLSSHLELVTAKFSDLPAQLHTSTIALNPREVCPGIPQKLLNYMAAGKPIVSFAGSAKILKHEVTGYIVDSPTPMDFAEGVFQLLDHPQLARALGANALRLAQRDYSWGRVAESALGIYHKILHATAAQQSVVRP